MTIEFRDGEIVVGSKKLGPKESREFRYDIGDAGYVYEPESYDEERKVWVYQKKRR